MSVSSGSDVTIPIQDSPPPPPSPYGNTRNGKENGSKSQSKSGRITPEPRGDITIPSGIENKAYSPSESEKNGSPGSISKKKLDHTEINLGNGETHPEAVNSELINMSVMSSIPAKPQSEFGPYEQMDDYFIPVNQHKKFLSRRSEKLYVTKDKRKEGKWKKYLCWTFGAFILAAIIAVAILAGVGVIPQGSEKEGILAQIGSTTPSLILISSTTTTEEPYKKGSPVTVIPSDSNVPLAATVDFDITTLQFEAALANKSSERFHQLSSEVQNEMKKILQDKANLTNVTVRVDEFTPGSVHVKMYVGWMDESMGFESLQKALMGTFTLGNNTILPMALNKIGNKCKFQKNGCSDSCLYDYESLEFLCACTEMMLLSKDNKTCETPSTAQESSPEPEPEGEPSPASTVSEEAVVSSSPEPSAEPELSPEESTQASPEPEPEIVPEESEKVISSSIAPEIASSSIEVVAISTTSSTTASPRQEPLEEEITSVPEVSATGSEEKKDSEDAGENEPQPEVPTEPEITLLSTSTTTTITTTTTTEQSVPIEEDIAMTTSSPVKSQDVVPSEDIEHVTIAPLRSQDIGSSEEASENSHEDSVIVHEPSPSTTTSTTTEVPTLAIVGETVLEQDQPNSSNLQRGSSLEVNPNESKEKLQSVTEQAPTIQPVSHEVAFETVPILPATVSSNNSSGGSSSERVARQETYGSGSLEEQVQVTDTPIEVPRAVPNSGEFMVFSDSQPASVTGSSTSTSTTMKQTGNSGEQISSENSSSDVDTKEEIETINVNNPIELPSQPQQPSPVVLPSSGEIEETTTFRPHSLHTDININNEAGVTVASAREYDNIEGHKVVSVEFPSSELSVETEEDRPNRDHRNASDEVNDNSTVVPIVFDVEEVDNSEAEGVTDSTVMPETISSSTTTTTVSPVGSSTMTRTELSTSSTTTTTTISPISVGGRGGESSQDIESENELL